MLLYPHSDEIIETAEHQMKNSRITLLVCRLFMSILLAIGWTASERYGQAAAVKGMVENLKDTEVNF